MGRTYDLAQLKYKMEQVERQQGLSFTGGGLQDNGTNSPLDTFGNVRTPNPDRLVLVTTSASAETDGTTIGRVTLEIQDSDGVVITVQRVASVETGGNSDIKVEGSSSAMVPPDGAYEVVNSSDPLGSNQVLNIQEHHL